MKYILLTLFCLAAWLTGAQTYYIDYSTGSDTNNGLSTNAPWQHHPFMVGFTGTYTHNAGDQYIFRGGVTWSSSCFPLNVSVNGSANASDYYGVSSSYYAGSSWTKPIWDDNGNPLDTMAGNSMVYFVYNNQTIDSIVFTNLNWNSSNIVSCINMGSGSNIVVTNCEFRNIINNALGPGSDNMRCISGYSGGSVGTKVSHCIFTCLPNTNYSGCATYYANTWEYNTVSYMPNGFVGICTTCQYNNVSAIQQSVDTTSHENCIEIFIPQDTNSYIHHNVVTNNPAGELMNISALGINNGHTGTVYVYDNIVANNPGTLTPAMQFDGSASNGASFGTRGIAYAWNNTIQDPLPAAQSAGFIRVVYRDNSQWAAVTAQNDHFITEGTGGVEPDPNCTTVITQANNVIISNATATAYGYTAANAWAPTSTNCPTVGTGTNLSSLNIFNTDILDKPRPALPLAWDVGSYQYPIQGVPIVGGGTVPIVGGGTVPIVGVQ